MLLKKFDTYKLMCQKDSPFSYFILSKTRLKRFYRSATCRNYHDRSTGMYLQGDLYVVEEFLEEIR